LLCSIPTLNRLLEHTWELEHVCTVLTAGGAFDLYGCHVRKCCMSDWVSDRLLEYQLNAKVVVKHIHSPKHVHA